MPVELTMTTGSQVTDFIKNSLEQIKGGITDGFNLNKDIEFELSVTEKIGGGGEIRTPVIIIGGKIEKEAVQKIKFSVSSDRTTT